MLDQLFRGLWELWKAWYFHVVLAGALVVFSWSPYARMGVFTPEGSVENARVLFYIGMVSFLFNGRIHATRAWPVLGGLFTLIVWYLSIASRQFTVLGVNLNTYVRVHHLVFWFGVVAGVSYLMVAISISKSAKYVHTGSPEGDNGPSFPRRVQMAFGKLLAFVFLMEYVETVPVDRIPNDKAYMPGRTAAIARRRVLNQKKEVEKSRISSRQREVYKAQLKERMEQQYYVLWQVGRMVTWSSFAFLVPAGYAIYKGNVVLTMQFVSVFVTLYFVSHMARIIGDTTKAARRRMFIGLVDLSVNAYAIIVSVLFAITMYESYLYGKHDFYTGYTGSADPGQMILWGVSLVVSAFILVAVVLILEPPKKDDKKEASQ